MKSQLSLHANVVEVEAAVSVADLAKGVYFVQLQHEAGITVRKVVVR